MLDKTLDSEMRRVFADVWKTENGTDDISWTLEGQDYPRSRWELGDEEAGR